VIPSEILTPERWRAFADWLRAMRDYHEELARAADRKDVGGIVQAIRSARRVNMEPGHELTFILAAVAGLDVEEVDARASESAREFFASRVSVKEVS
jgi:hypothetical protein